MKTDFSFYQDKDCGGTMCKPPHDAWGTQPVTLESQPQEEEGAVAFTGVPFLPTSHPEPARGLFTVSTLHGCLSDVF